MLLHPRSRSLAYRAAQRLPPAGALVGASLLLASLSLLLPSAPTYDPWAWIIWGREITQLDLDTVDGPSWKPLPVLLTTLAAPLGEASPYIWLVVARAGAIAALALTFLLAARLAGPVAGVGAAIGLGLMSWWFRNGALGNSEGLLVALVLAAVLLHLQGRRGWPFALAVGAGLLRPEAWPFLGLYALWMLWEDRARLRWIAGGLATLPLLWLLPEWWGSGNAFRASDRAQTPNADSPAFADDPALKVVENGVEMVPTAAVAGAAVALVLAAVSRRSLPAVDRRAALGLGVFAVLWIGLVAAMTVRGFSGNGRYLVVPAALLIILGAVGAVWLARALLGARRLPALAGVVGAVALCAAFVGPKADLIEYNLRGIAYQADLYHDLGDAIAEAGGSGHLRDCGHAFTGPYLVPQVAWRLGVHIRDVDLAPVPPATIFHVRTIERAGVVPPLAERRPQVLARDGHWAITADCGPAR